MLIPDEFENLTPAEEKLLAECGKPGRIMIGEGEVPETDGPAVNIRAGLIRHLLTASDSPLDGKGIRLRGAHITGPLDLQGIDCSRDITLTACRISDPITVINAAMRGLHISGCAMGSLHADNARFSGSLYIRRDSRVKGELSLAGTRIAGDLQICGCVIESEGQDAIFAASLRVEGSVFLGNYPYSDGVTTLEATGGLFFSSAHVGHDFFITNTAISPQADPVADAVFGATEEHGRDIALSLSRAKVGGILYFQDNQISSGVVNLAGADVARLKDEPEGPGATYALRLDGFRYSDFSRHTDISLKARLSWLERRPADMEFVAQPYEQLAQVLAHLGHRNDAKSVLMAKEHLLRVENRRLMRERGQWGRYIPSALLGWVFGRTVGYGYRPGRALGLALVLIVALGVFFQKTWDAGDMTPNAAPVLISADWIAATVEHPDGPAAFWSQPGQAGQDWETFNAYAYSADLFIPIINLGQESAWAPSTSRSDWGRVGWWLRWFAKAVGWMITALVAAGITGMIRQE